MSNTLNKEQLTGHAWESLDRQQTLDLLFSSEAGLSDQEVAQRLADLGENRLPEEKQDSALKRFLLQFNNALIYVLLAATVLTAVLQHWLDTFVIIGVVIINALIGYVQEDKAKKALEGIKHMLAPKASVIRDGKRSEIPAEELVPGDIVRIKSGDKIPADLRLLEASRLEIEEASLTGESEAVVKEADSVEEGTLLGERTSMAYTGTTVQAGDGKGVVVATASDTELGKINTMLSETESMTTPLIRKINDFGKKLSFLIIGFSILIFLYGLFVIKTPLEASLLSVIGLAVAAIPEGLPAILTITLAIGVQRMAARKAIIRKLPSVETLGSVTVICSDKTGTLTRNEMTAVSIDTAEGSWQIEGEGYKPEGNLIPQTNPDRKQEEILADPVLRLLLACAELNNTSEISQNDKGQWYVQGAPTEGALKVLSIKTGFADVKNTLHDSIPFDSSYKYRASLHTYENDRIILSFGAPDRLLDLCDQQMRSDGPEPLDKALWEEKISARADQGQRMLGCAYKKVTSDQESLDHDDLKKDLVFLGVTGIIDPPRPEAIEAIKACQSAGITVKMITGDHLLTARSIGKQMGIGDGEIVMGGAELEKLDDESLQEAVKTCDIFARTSPEHKLRLVRALQANGDICAMTGDGVNDAPALKKADIGIAMGIKGTEVTKDAATMVLADDNFASIASAVEEGRTIYDNLRKTLLFMLPTNGAEALVIVIAILFNLTMPITPVQILWINMVTAITLGMALAFEKSESNVMSRPPMEPSAPIIGRYFGFRIGFVSLLIGLVTLLAFLLLKEQGIELARTVAINTLVFAELFYLYNCRKVDESIFNRGLFSNKVALLVSLVLLLLQAGFTYLPFMNTLFDTVPVRPVYWLYSLVGGLFILLVVELEKKITQRWR